MAVDARPKAATDDWRESYTRHRPLLFGALGKLARTGFVIPPDESLDLVQSFFAEAWPGLHERYDPSKARFETYLYGAFLRFARPRIKELQVWRSRLVDAVELHETLTGVSRSEPDLNARLDAELVTQAIDRLPTLEREVLLAFVEAGESERAIATGLRVSRHRVREVLVDALGRVAVSVTQASDVAPADWRVALALWRDLLPPRAAAARLSLSLPQLRKARSRLFRRFSHGLAFAHTHRSASLQKECPNMKPLELLNRVLSSCGDEKLLAELRKHATDVLHALEYEEYEESVTPAPDFNQVDAAWVGHVYEALAPTNKPSKEELESLGLLVEAQRTSERAVGQAFRDSLLPGLPDYLQDLALYLAPCPKLSPDAFKLVLETPSVDAGAPATQGPAHFGVTPLTILAATDAVADLTRRLVRREVLPRSSHMILLEPKKGALSGLDEPLIRYEWLVQEIYEVAACPMPTAEALYRWLLDVGARRPSLFRGFRSEPTKRDALTLKPSSKPKELWNELYKIWGSEDV